MPVITDIAEKAELTIQVISAMAAEAVKSARKPFSHRYDIGRDIFELFQLPPFPYTCRLSFRPLLQFWEKHREGQDASNLAMASQILNLAKQYPEFGEPIEDLRLLNEHPDLVDLLISGYFPSLLEDKQLARISQPFHGNPFYHTPLLQSIFDNDKYEFFFTIPVRELYEHIVISAGNLILVRLYNYPHFLKTVTPIGLRDNERGLERYFRFDVNYDFVEVVPTQPLPDLSGQQIEELMDNVHDLNKWLTALPPDHFEFRGVSLTSLYDVTKSEVMSQLKYLLLERSALLSEKNVHQLRQKLRNFFQLPQLDLGVTLLEEEGSRRSQERRAQIQHELVDHEGKDYLPKKLHAPILRRTVKTQQPVFVEDLEKGTSNSEYEQLLLENGFRSLLFVPLCKKDQLIGILELASKVPHDLNRVTIYHVGDIAGLFSLALQRSLKEIDNLIDSIIRKEFTSLHPSVEWRFEKNAFHILKKIEKGETDYQLDPLLFHDVYPLYGQADIVGSSLHRNQAIQSDLLENLYKAKLVLVNGLEHCRFPLLRQALVEVEELSASVKTGITSGNEYEATQYIRQELHPLFREIGHKDKAIAQTVQKYFNSLDPALDVVYDKRKGYQDSVSQINAAISLYLDEEQKSAQQMVPHFYEKYQTDGVAYNIYAGQSLLQEGRFSRVHLSNLRLWQLLTMCEITRLVDRLQEKLALPLVTAQLILVHSTPLSIRFRMDEKRFDVDGTYNARYEILKKRIDKALVEGTRQRLTQAGKIAISYQHEKDRLEYERYLRYLMKEGYIEPEIETLHLGKLQGVQGLNAFRVTVKNAHSQNGNT